MTKYKCKNCGSTYDTKCPALNCCYGISQVYQCEICDDVWEEKWQAQECCLEIKIDVVEE